jgi:hypothetical protein
MIKINNFILMLVVLMVLKLLFKNNTVLKNNILTFKAYMNRFHINYDDYNKPQHQTKTLYIVTHDYHHIDIIGIIYILSNFKKNNYYCITANDWLNKLFELIGNIIGCANNIKLIYTKTGAVNKSIKLLNQNNNVVVFLHKHKKNTGIYNIIKNSRCKVVLVSIISRKKINKNTYFNSKLAIALSYINEDFDITIENFNNSYKNSDDCLTKIKKLLYKN